MSEPTMIDHGHRGDCGYCQGAPARSHRYQPAEPADKPNRPTRADAEAAIALFPGARIVDRRGAGPDEAHSLPDLNAAVRTPDVRPGSEDLVGKLCCFRPLGIVEVNGEYGLAAGTETYIVEVVEDAQPGEALYVDLGRIPLLWQHVRHELNKCTPEVPWTIGTIVKRTKAYFLNNPTPERSKVAEAALLSFIEDRKGAAVAAPEPGQ